MVGRIQQFSISELLASAAMVHYADPSGWCQPHRARMMLECNTGELLARAAFMHHNAHGHDILRHI